MSLTYFDAFTRIGPVPKAHPRHWYSLDHLLRLMKQASISGALVTSTGQLQYDAMFENLRLSATLAKHDHLFPVWNVLPAGLGDVPEPAELMAMLRQHGVRAVTLSPGTNNWSLTSRTSRPLLQALEQSKTLAIINHDLQGVTPDVLERFADLYPQLPVLLTHVWWSKSRPVFMLLKQYRNLHLSLEHCQVNMAIEHLAGEGCEDQMVFASNAPSMSSGAHRMAVDYAEVSPTVKAKIAGGNLSRLLHGLTPPREMVNADEDAIMAEAREGRPLSVPVLDMHAHMLDEGLHTGGSAYPMFHGGPTGVRRLAQRMGVDGIGIMSWNGTVGVHAELGNQCVKAALDAYPDFYWGLATFDVLHRSAEEMTGQMHEIFADRRFLGLKPYPQYGVPYDDARFDCWWQFGNQRKLYCGLHPVKWFRRDEFDSICSRFPDLTVVAYHCGGSYDYADVAIAMAQKHANFRAEITLTPVCAGIVEYLVEGCGAERVMYGSDLPMRDPRQQLGWVVYADLPVEQKLAVLGGNAKALLARVRGA